MKFYYKSFELDVPEGIYYPREDSMLLAEVIERLDLAKKKCLEMGCGSGFLSLLMAGMGAAVDAADINRQAVTSTQKNAAAHNLPVSAFVSDLFDNARKSYDLIVFNPPYLPVHRDEPKDITYYGGISGRDVIEPFLAEAAKRLNRNGKILLLVSTVTGIKETMAAAAGAGLKARIAARKKVPWEELMVLELMR